MNSLAISWRANLSIQNQLERAGSATTPLSVPIMEILLRMMRARTLMQSERPAITFLQLLFLAYMYI